VTRVIAHEGTPSGGGRELRQGLVVPLSLTNLRPALSHHLQDSGRDQRDYSQDDERENWGKKAQDDQQDADDHQCRRGG